MTAATEYSDSHEPSTREERLARRIADLYATDQQFA
jgi:hypothetical protein